MNREKQLEGEREKLKGDIAEREQKGHELAAKIKEEEDKLAQKRKEQEELQQTEQSNPISVLSALLAKEIIVSVSIKNAGVGNYQGIRGEDRACSGET